MEAVNRVRPARLLALAVSAGLVIWSGSQVAGLVWHVLAPDTTAAASDLRRWPAPASATAGSDIDLPGVQQVFVLSAPGADVGPGADLSSASTVETRLALVLKGAVLSSDSQYSRAIIASADAQQVYRPGDTLLNTPGTVVLQAIYHAHVVLDNNGRQEVLRMDEPAQPVTASAPDQYLQAAPVSAVQAAVMATPASSTASFAGRPLSDLLRIQPMFATPGDNSSLQGLQIRHGSRQDFLRAVGLQQGDVITAIDGQRLDDVARLPALMEQWSNARQVALTVVRDGQDVQLTVSRDLL